MVADAWPLWEACRCQRWAGMSLALQVKLPKGSLTAGSWIVSWVHSGGVEDQCVMYSAKPRRRGTVRPKGSSSQLPVTWCNALQPNFPVWQQRADKVQRPRPQLLSATKL